MSPSVPLAYAVPAGTGTPTSWWVMKADVMDGFPVHGLVESFFGTPGSAGRASSRERRVVDEVLSHWVDILAHDIAQIPAASPPAVLAIRARMVAAKLALDQVRAKLLGLQAGNAVEKQDDAAPQDLIREPELQH